MSWRRPGATVDREIDAAIIGGWDGTRDVVGIVVALGALLGACHRAGSANPVASATERRDLLLQPDAAYWNEASPAEYRVSVETTKGTFVIAVTRALAPRGADRFYRPGSRRVLRRLAVLSRRAGIHRAVRDSRRSGDHAGVEGPPDAR
jgi:hypothetical protein